MSARVVAGPGGAASLQPMALVRVCGFLGFGTTRHSCPSSWKAQLFFPHRNHLRGCHSLAPGPLLSLHCHFKATGGTRVQQLFAGLPVGLGSSFPWRPQLSPAPSGGPKLTSPRMNDGENQKENNP